MESREIFAADMIGRKNTEIKKMEADIIWTMERIIERAKNGNDWSVSETDLLMHKISSRDTLAKKVEGMSEIFEFMAGE